MKTLLRDLAESDSEPARRPAGHMTISHKSADFAETREHLIEKFYAERRRRFIADGFYRHDDPESVSG